MPRHTWIGSSLLLLSVLGTGGGLAFWKLGSLEAQSAAAAQQPEHQETITVAVADHREHRRTTTAIGTVVALRSITLHNELPGTVAEVALTPGAIVEEGTVLVALDVAVEQAELRAQEARAALAETMLGRMQRASEKSAASAVDVDRALSERDVAKAEVARIKAVIGRKTIRAPFRARVGMADVHVGQYLLQGTQLTTLQGMDESVHIDFAVPQAVAANLQQDAVVQVVVASGTEPIDARVVAVDARVDPMTRNATVRARLDAGHAPAPGASVRVRVPVDEPRQVVTVPVCALRRGPAGDHVFVIQDDPSGRPRAHMRPVRGGPMLGDVVVVLEGLAVGERVAATGSFKLYEGVLVAIAPDAPARN